MMEPCKRADVSLLDKKTFKSVIAVIKIGNTWIFKAESIAEMLAKLAFGKALPF